MTALPVLYSFRRCPYAMRARLALAVSGQGQAGAHGVGCLLYTSDAADE